MFFCGALANFLSTVLLVSISLLYLHVAFGELVYLNPSIQTEVIDREAYTPSGVRLVYYKQRLRVNKRIKTSVKSFADSAYSICFLRFSELRVSACRS